MSRLLLLSSLRSLLRHPAQLVLSLLGVALGVAVVVAMDLAVESSREAFRVSSETLAGRSTHAVVGDPGGVPDSVFRLVRVDAGIRMSAPVVEGYATSPALPDRPLRVLGVDPFSEGPFRPYLSAGGTGARGGEAEGPPATALLARTGALLLSRETAEEVGISAGDTIPLRAAGPERSAVVAGVLNPDDALGRQGLRDLLVMDVSEAQSLLGRSGRLDRIDLVLSDGAAGEAEARELRSLLPPSVAIEEAELRTGAMAGMLRAFDLNLTALSLLALLFGVFLIYNTMTFSVVRRREALGTLRALGVTPGELSGLVLAEAVVLGALGSGLGLLLGVVLGDGLVELVARTVNDLYFVVSVTGVAISGGVLLKGLALGVGATVVAALVPAREAARVPPREALRRSSVEESSRAAATRHALAGTGLVLAGAATLLFPTTSVVPGFVGLFVAVAGIALLTPAASALLVRGFLPLLGAVAGVVGRMAGRGVLAARSRTGPALAALVVAVAVTVALGVMIQSFRGSVDRWLETTLQADLHVSSPVPGASRPGGELPPEVTAGVGEVAGVAGVTRSRRTRLGARFDLIDLVVLDLDPRGEAAFDLLSGDPAHAFRAFRQEEGVFVSEPLAYRTGRGPGDGITLPTAGGERTFEVVAVYRDYGSERGTATVARSTYERHWEDPVVTTMSVYLEEGADGDAVTAAIRDLAPVGAPLEVRSNRELRAASLQVFDRTFRVTVALRLLAFLVAFIGVLAALMALQLERGRELGVLRAAGMTPGQLWRMVTAQTGIMGTVAGLLAIPSGIALALVMVFVVNRRSFGWTLDLEVGLAVPLQGVALAVVGALLAGLYPAWRMSRTPAARALQEE